MLNTLLLREGRDISDPLWLVTQTDSLVDIRSTLVGWLRKAIIAHHQCSITTLEHAINLLDRFLFKTGFMVRAQVERSTGNGLCGSLGGCCLDRGAALPRTFSSMHWDGTCCNRFC